MRRWAALAAPYGCSDSREHRRRVERRRPDLEGHAVPTWNEVLAREYEPWTEPRLVVDSCAPRPESIDRIREYLAS
jgi:hypothetical protein